MLEVSLVEGSRRQDDRKGAFARVSHPEHAVAQLAEEPADTPYLFRSHRLRQNLLDDLAIFERIAGTRGRLSTVCEDPPTSVRGSREIRGIQRQPVATLRDDTVARPQEVRMPECKLRRYNTLGNQTLRPIKIGEQCIQGARTLRQASFDGAPLRGIND